MPTYEYACTSCGHRFEAVQSFSDPALTACPVCQGPLRKVFGNVGIVLKGSGFYKTDSRKAGSNGSSPKTKSSSDDSGSEKAAPAGGTGSADKAAAPTPSSTGTEKGSSAD